LGQPGGHRRTMNHACNRLALVVESSRWVCFASTAKPVWNMNFTKFRPAVWIIAVLASGITAWGNSAPTAGSFFNGPMISPNQEQQQAYEFKERQAEIAAQKAEDQNAAKQADWEKFRDDALAKINTEAQSAIDKLDAETLPTLNDLESKESIMESRATELENQRQLSEQKNNHLRNKQLFQPKDPWRLLDGKIYNAKDQNWFLFTGTVLEVRPNGILVDGDFGEPLEKGFGKRNYFVENFPNETYPLADGESILANMNLVAHMGGKTTCQFTNSTIDLRYETVRRLDYGTIVNNPPADLVQRWQIPILAPVGADQWILDELNTNQLNLSAIKSTILPIKNKYDQAKSDINAERDRKIADLPNVYAKVLESRQDETKRQLQATVLAQNQQQADEGDPIALMRMGERYRDGDGVEKDLIKSAEYFKKADAAVAAQQDQLNNDSKIREQAAQKQKFEWYLDQAEKGAISGMIGAGKCYRDGIGVEKDLDKAREYFDKASNLGSDEAGALKAAME